MDTAQPFIGFATLEEFARVVNPARPLLAMPLIESGPPSGGLQTDELLVVCQQVDTEGSVLYCRLKAASLTRCFGEPFDPDWQERESAWKSLWAAVEAYLKSRGFVLRRATVALPKGYVFLRGRAEGIRFDRVSKTYQQVVAASPEPAPAP